MVVAQAMSFKVWYKSSYDQTTSLFFIEKFTFAVWKVTLSPTDMDQKYFTGSQSLSLNIKATCLLLSSPRNFPYEIKMDKYRLCLSMISTFTYGSTYPLRSRHAVHLGATVPPSFKETCWKWWFDNCVPLQTVLNLIHRRLLSFPMAGRVSEINRIYHWCSVVTEKSQLNGGPDGWDFSRTTEHQWSILFLIYHDRTVQCCILSVGDVTEVDVYGQWRAPYKSTWNSEEIAHWTMNKWLFHQNGFTRISLSATVTRVSYFVEENVFLLFFLQAPPPPPPTVQLTHCQTG